jgi:hypothetical protein
VGERAFSSFQCHAKKVRADTLEVEEILAAAGDRMPGLQAKRSANMIRIAAKTLETRCLRGVTPIACIKSSDKTVFPSRNCLRCPVMQCTLCCKGCGWR